MIPEAFITEWSRQAPWPTDTHIEQDLILSRLMVEIANDQVLGPEFAMRGGTCLHKLHLAQPYRYSEDLDYVRRTHSGIKPYMDALRTIATGVGLTEHHYEQSGQMVHMIFDAASTSGVGVIRIKIETNIREVHNFEGRRNVPFRVQSSWWEGAAEIPTFTLEELTGTKLRALYQRRKGRDLFDLWLVLDGTSVDDGRIVAALDHYMGDEAFSFRELADNLMDKLANSDFQSDLDQLVLDTPRRDPYLHIPRWQMYNHDDVHHIELSVAQQRISRHRRGDERESAAFGGRCPSERDRCAARDPRTALRRAPGCSRRRRQRTARARHRRVKRRDLERHLRGHGTRLLREGGNHSLTFAAGGRNARRT